jgi:hypothetical protein
MLASATKTPNLDIHGRRREQQDARAQHPRQANPSRPVILYPEKINRVRAKKPKKKVNVGLASESLNPPPPSALSYPSQHLTRSCEFIAKWTPSLTGPQTMESQMRRNEAKLPEMYKVRRFMRWLFKASRPRFFRQEAPPAKPQLPATHSHSANDSPF